MYINVQLLALSFFDCILSISVLVFFFVKIVSLSTKNYRKLAIIKGKPYSKYKILAIKSDSSAPNKHPLTLV